MACHGFRFAPVPYFLIDFMNSNEFSSPSMKSISCCISIAKLLRALFGFYFCLGPAALITKLISMHLAYTNSSSWFFNSSSMKSFWLQSRLRLSSIRWVTPNLFSYSANALDDSTVILLF
jgi:hypothetical protein